MSVSAIGPISLASPVLAAPGAATATGGVDFAGMVGRNLEALQASQAKADDLAIQAATGTLADVHDYTIAATEASLATRLTVAVRNKGLEAFNEIMRMQA